MRTFLALAMLASLSACPTSFTGNAFVEDGRSGCEHKCKKAKLRMSALVYLGEYSTACVCEVAPASTPAPADAGVTPPAAPEPSNAPSASAASLGAAVGVAISQPADPDRPAAVRW